MLEYYNNTTKTLTIPYIFNEELKDISTDTKYIIFSQNYENSEYSKFNREIKENVLPVSLHTLTFGFHFDQEIKENVLPTLLHTLTFSCKFNQEIKENVLPCSLHTLKFGWLYNQQIKENVLPNILHTLIFGCEFNQEININVLPKSLHTLIFNWRFNQDIKENVLPVSLHTLIFGWFFNQEIKENVLPCSIKKIGMYSHCNLINNLQLWIKEVYIMFSNGSKCNKEITNLPITLEKITISDEIYLKYITKIPFGCDIVIQKIE
jgi:hypothetical protein